MVSRSEIHGGLADELSSLPGTTPTKRSVENVIALSLRNGVTVGSLDYLITGNPTQAASFVRSWHQRDTVQRARWSLLPRRPLPGITGWLVQRQGVIQAVAAVGPMVILAEPGYVPVTSASRARIHADAEALLRFGGRQARSAGAT
jgi:hypothetical protein